MTTQPPRRIATLTVTIDVPMAVDEAVKEKLIHAAHNCPVVKSIHPDIQVPVEFKWA